MIVLQLFTNNNFTGQIKELGIPLQNNTIEQPSNDLV